MCSSVGRDVLFAQFLPLGHRREEFFLEGFALHAQFVKAKGIGANFGRGHEVVDFRDAGLAFLNGLLQSCDAVLKLSLLGLGFLGWQGRL